MGVKPFFAISILTSAALVSACSGRSTVSVPPESNRSVSSVNSGLNALPSAQQIAAGADARARVDAKLAAGYLYQVSGTARTINVAIGKLPQFAMGPGDHIDVKLVPKTEPRYLITGHGSKARSRQSITDGCEDGCDGSGSTPAPSATPPPNYGPCSSIGGATWANNLTGEGGCTSQGNTTSLTCGTWTWSARGKGTLVVPGSGTFTDVDYVVDNGNGGCRLGFV
jgi:hypothetical protein